MAQVQVIGKLMGYGVDSRTYDGNTRQQLLIDLYQSESSDRNKSVQVRTDDLTFLNKFQQYDDGAEVALVCSTRGYRNDVYFNLISIMGA